MNTTKRSVLLDTISRNIFLGTLILLPIFCIPFVYLSIDFDKLFLLSIGVLLSFIFWLIARLFDDSFSFPKSIILLGLLCVVGATLLSTIFSPVFRVSFIGDGFQLQSLFTTIILAVSLFLASITFQSVKRLTLLYGGLLVALTIVLLFQAVHIFFPTLTTFGIFVDKIGNVIGSWNDLAIFFGLGILLSLVTFELIARAQLKIFLGAVIFLCLSFLAVINFVLSWILVGGCALIFFVYLSSLRSAKHTEDGAFSLPTKPQKIPFLSLIIVVISVIFIIGSSIIGPLVPRMLGISSVDIRPSLSTTFTIAKQSLSHRPVFGAGPNRFIHDWLAYKPTAVNATQFWNIPFTTGFGLVPSFVVTLGILGTLAWLFFLGSFIYEGSKKLFLTKDQSSSYVVGSSFLLSLYLWIAVCTYAAGSLITVLAFVVTGVFIGLLVQRRLSPQIQFVYLRDPRSSFFTILSLVIFLIFSVSGLYLSVKNFSSSIFLEQGTQVLSTSGPSARAESLISKATALNPIGDNYLILSQVYQSRLSQFLNSQSGQGKVDPAFQSAFSSAESAIRQAVMYDKTNVDNWRALGNLYQFATTLGVDGAYDNAKSSFSQAQTLDPNNPSMFLDLARLELAHKNTDNARTLIHQALSYKPDYLDAFLMLSDLEASAGNTKEALLQAQTAVSIDPTNSNALFQLGTLEYNSGNFQNSTAVFEQLVKLFPDSPNAHYLLGLSYYRGSRVSDSLKQFQYLQTALPNNAVITAALNNLQAGLSPVPNAPVPTNSGNPTIPAPTPAPSTKK